MSDFNSPFDRDLMIAARMGARAAHSEAAQPACLAGSHKIRDDFRKGILSRYTLASFKDQHETTAYVLSLRAKLDAAYYGQPEIKIVRLVTPEPVGFDVPGEVTVLDDVLISA